MNNDKNTDVIIKTKEINNKSLTENNLISNTQLNSEKKYKNRININKNIISNIKTINNQKLKKLTIYKKIPDLIMENLNPQINVSLKENNQNNNIERFIYNKNSNNYNDKFSNKDKNINTFKINNITKKDNYSSRNNIKHNFINIKNVNINNISFNNNIFYTRISLLENYNNPKLNSNNNRIKINPINNLTFNSLTNISSNPKDFNDVGFKPYSYRSIFLKKSPSPVIKLKEFTATINNFKPTQLEKEKNDQFKYTIFKNPIKYSEQGYFLVNKKNIQRRK